MDKAMSRKVEYSSRIKDTSEILEVREDDMHEI